MTPKEHPDEARADVPGAFLDEAIRPLIPIVALQSRAIDERAKLATAGSCPPTGPRDLVQPDHPVEREAER